MSLPGPAALALASADNPWFSWRYVHDNSESILAALREHLALTGQAVLLATLLAVPLAVFAHWYRPARGPILALSGVLYTIPSLALFALLVPYTGIGRGTVLIGLVMYALLLIVRNALTGLAKVPPEVTDAARGMGYGRLAQLVRIDLPLALPGIMTGLRLATVSTVALVTVGAQVGHGGFGQLILAGFRNNFYKAEIAANTVMCVLVALVLDVALAGAARALTPWTRRVSSL